MIEHLVSFVSRNPFLGLALYILSVLSTVLIILVGRGAFPLISYHIFEYVQIRVLKHLLITVGLGAVALLLTVVMILSFRVAFPKIVTYPWPERVDKDKSVVIAGSYNPPHNGHLAMIRYLASRYNEVHVVIGFNPNKVYDVSPEKRAQLLQRMIESSSALDDKCKIKVRVVSGYIWRYAMSQKIKIFYRGIRSWQSDGKDETNLHILNSWGPIVFGPLKVPLKTIFLEGDPKYKNVSSTLVREVCKYGMKERLKGLVPDKVADEVLEAYNQSI
jgi:pantetheine-phosphate adenylyltransferase